VAIEAMACGSPFVGTKVAGIADNVQDGRTGFLVEPGDAGPLSVALAQVISQPDKAREVALRGSEYVHQRLDWETIVRQVRDEVYARVVP
jgi:glycosyltransferase involved in cell wall biosynthesis